MRRNFETDSDGITQEIFVFDDTPETFSFMTEIDKASKEAAKYAQLTGDWEHWLALQMMYRIASEGTEV